MQLQGPPKINGWKAPMPSKATPMEGEWRRDEEVDTIIKYRNGRQRIVGDPHWRGTWRVVWDGITYDTAFRILYEVGSKKATGSGTGGSNLSGDEFLWTPRSNPNNNPVTVDVDGDGVADIVLQEIEVAARIRQQPSTTPLYRRKGDGTKVVRLELQIESADTFPERAGLGFPPSISFGIEVNTGDNLDLAFLENGSDTDQISGVLIDDSGGRVAVLDYPTDFPYSFPSTDRYSVTIVAELTFDSVDSVEVNNLNTNTGFDASTLDFSQLKDLTEFIISGNGINSVPSSWLPSTGKLTYFNGASGSNYVGISTLPDSIQKIDRGDVLKGTLAGVPLDANYLDLNRSSVSGDTRNEGIGGLNGSKPKAKPEFIYAGRAGGVTLHSDQLQFLDAVNLQALIEGDAGVIFENNPRLETLLKHFNIQGDLTSVSWPSDPLPLEKFEAGGGSSYYLDLAKGLDRNATSRLANILLWDTKQRYDGNTADSQDRYGADPDDVSTWDDGNKDGNSGLPTGEIAAFQEEANAGNVNSGLEYKGHFREPGGTLQILTTLHRDALFRALGLGPYHPTESKGPGLIDAISSVVKQELVRMDVQSIKDPDSDGTYEVIVADFTIGPPPSTNERTFQVKNSRLIVETLQGGSGVEENVIQPNVIEYDGTAGGVQSTNLFRVDSSDLTTQKGHYIPISTTINNQSYPYATAIDKDNDGDNETARVRIAIDEGTGSITYSHPQYADQTVGIDNNLDGKSIAQGDALHIGVNWTD